MGHLQSVDSPIAVGDERGRLHDTLAIVQNFKGGHPENRLKNGSFPTQSGPLHL